MPALQVYQTVNIVLLISAGLLMLLPCFVHGRRGKYGEAFPGAQFPCVFDIAYAVLIIVLFIIQGVSGMSAGNVTLPEITPSESWSRFAVNTAVYIPLLIRMVHISLHSSSGAFCRCRPPYRFFPEVAAVLGLEILFNAAYSNTNIPQVLTELTCSPQEQIAVSVLQTAQLSVCYPIILLAVVVAPAGEEFFFRGLLYNLLRQRIGPSVGAVLSSFLFGAVHCSLLQTVPLCVFGFLQCRLYERTRSLAAVILSHALFNALPIALIFIMRSCQKY